LRAEPRGGLERLESGGNENGKRDTNRRGREREREEEGEREIACYGRDGPFSLVVALGQQLGGRGESF